MSTLTKLLETPQPADLGPSPRPGISLEKQLDDSLAAAFRETKLPAVNEQLIRALILLWHDHLDAAHTLAQSIENADGAYVHAIMHRREPDYGNSAYWFRRVGRHPAYAELARKVEELLGSTGNNKLQRALLSKREWDPFAFVDACEQAANGALSKDDQKCLREIQRVEFHVLLDFIVAVDVRRL